MGTGIEWTDETWNPLVGCSRVSAGCDHCYALRMANRLANSPTLAPADRWKYRDMIDHPDGETADWSGLVTYFPERMAQPLRWRKPRMIFVGSMGDIWHGDVSSTLLAALFAVMAACPQHTFQLLTKRPHRMPEWLAWMEAKAEQSREVYPNDDLAWRRANVLASAAVHHGVCDGEAAACHRYRLAATNIMEAGWTLPNVWVGTTVENQPAADERIPHLLATPAAVRFVSCEPLLGPVDVWPKTASGALLNRGSVATGRGIDWVICGGETGPGARPMHPDWARSLRDQCVAARVPFFFKRWGEWAPDGFEHANRPNAPACYLTADGNSYMADNWTPEHRCRDEKYAMVRVGKKAAGRELDGRTWDEMPDVAGEEDR